MSARYLSIDDILAEEERVPCMFMIQAHRLGHLDPTSGSEVRGQLLHDASRVIAYLADASIARIVLSEKPSRLLAHAYTYDDSFADGC